MKSVEIADISVDPRFTRIAGRFMPEERARVLADRDFYIAELKREFSEKGQVRAEAFCGYYYTGYYYPANRDELNEQTEGLNVTFNKYRGFDDVDLQSPISFSFKKAGGYIELTLENAAGFSMTEKLIKPFEMIDEDIDYYSEERRIQEAIRSYFRWTNFLFPRDPDYYKKDLFRRMGHAYGADMLQRSFLNKGVALGPAVSHYLFHILAHSYPAKENPFPYMVVGREWDMP